MPRTPDTPAPEKPLPQPLASDWTQLFDLLPVGLVLLDDDLAALHCNHFAERILGPADDWLTAWTQQADPPAGGAWRDILRAIRDGGPAQRFGKVGLARPGQPRMTLDVDVALLDRGDRRAVVIVLTDATREAELTERAHASDTLAAVGRLAARVAHELNNPLDGTLRYVSLSARLIAKLKAGAELPAGPAEKLEEYLAATREGLVRMTRIVADLLEFSRNSPILPDAGNINRVIEEAMNAVASQADANHVAMMADFHDDTRMPALPGTRLYQVCCNLLRNAIDAMPNGGTLTVCTGILEDQVIIRICDTGSGLPENIERIFEPFYTTKPAGKGTGLGLAICREYLAQLGGTLKGENARPTGAVFTVRIPLERCSRPSNSSAT